MRGVKKCKKKSINSKEEERAERVIRLAVEAAIEAQLWSCCMHLVPEIIKLMREVRRQRKRKKRK